MIDEQPQETDKSMYKNVQVNHCNSATSTTATAATTFSRSSPSSSFPFETSQTSTILPTQITCAPSSSLSSSIPITTHLPSLPNSTIGVNKVSDGGISLPVSFNPSNEKMSLSQSSKIKSDVDQLDELVKDLLIEVNRPLGTSTTNRNSTSNNNNNNNNNNNTNNNNNKSSASSSSYSYYRHSNNGNHDVPNPKLSSSLRASSYTQASTLNNQKYNDFDANAVSGLIEGSSVPSNGVQREEQRLKTTREERIRIKRGGGGSGISSGFGDGTEIPITTSSMKTTTTTTTTTKPTSTISSRDQLSIDEQLIDSLLESVQNTLRKRSQQQSQTTWTNDIPIQRQQATNSRRTYSSSAACTDSVHRMDPVRGRFPIKLVRTDSPTSTLSSRRPYSRQDNRDGYVTTVTSASTTAIPTHFRAASEPAPDGPIELRRMDLVRSPSRTYMDGHSAEYYPYSRSTLPANGIRVRGHDYSGYETDTGLVTSRAYGSRYYGGAPPPPPQPIQPQAPLLYPSQYMHYPSYPNQPAHIVRERQHETYQSNTSGGSAGGYRTMLRPDGYDTDTGLISSGRLRMTRTLPPRMAAIPETIVVNNRMVSSSNLNNVPNNLRSSSFLNETNTNTLRNRSENVSGYETDSGMNIRQQHHARQQIPIDIQYGDSGWVGKQAITRPMSQQRFVDYNQRYRSQDQLRSTSIPVYTQDASVTMSRLPEQHITITNKTHQKRTTNTLPSTLSTTVTSEVKPQSETMKSDSSVLPNFFPGSVGLSNPPSNNRSQLPESPELKRKFSGDNAIQKSTHTQYSVVETTIPSTSNEMNTTNSQAYSIAAELVPNVNVDRVDSQAKTPSTPSFPVTNQTYNQNVQTRVGNSSSRNQEENSRRSSISSAAESDVTRTGAYLAHNVSQYWYKEKMSREDAISLLKTKPPGSFLVRDSQGFPGSYGLAIKVETLPPGIQPKPGADPNAELVRHYLIERTPTGHVRLKGCPNEPDFVNLSALIHQHSIAPLALPIKLVLPTSDITEDYRSVTNQSSAPQQQETFKKMSAKDLLEKGAACNVVYLNNVDVESLSGQMAVNKALRSTFENLDRLQATNVHFKVSNNGITLTDTKKKLFSRRHFPKEYVTYCGVDYETDRYWTYQFPDLEMLPKAKCFGFVSKKTNGNNRLNQAENECHIFAEVDRTQPSTAIVNFVSKVMIGSVPV